MRLLLDTHTFLWFVAGDARLSASARRRIDDTRNDKFLSVASIWEIAIKVSLQKIDLDMSVDELIEAGALDNGIALLDVRREHAVAVAGLPSTIGIPSIACWWRKPSWRGWAWSARIRASTRTPCGAFGDRRSCGYSPPPV